MATIQDLTRLPAIRVADGYERESALGHFLKVFDRDARDILHESDEEDMAGVLSRVTAEVLLEGAGNRERHVVYRMGFDGNHFALVRHDSKLSDEDEPDEARPEGHIRVVHVATAHSVGTAIRAAVKVNAWCTTAAPWEDVGGLLDFGPTALLDLGTGALRFQSASRVGLFRDTEGGMGEGGFRSGLLLRLADGEYARWDNVGGVESWEKPVNPEEVVSAMAGIATAGWVPSRRPLMGHWNDGDGAVGVILTEDGLLCTVSKKHDKGSEVIGRGDDALGAFRECFRTKVLEAVRQFESNAAEATSQP